MASESCL